MASRTFWRNLLTRAIFSSLSPYRSGSANTVAWDGGAFVEVVMSVVARKERPNVRLVWGFILRRVEGVRGCVCILNAFVELVTKRRRSEMVGLDIKFGMITF